MFTSARSAAASPCLVSTYLIALCTALLAPPAFGAEGRQIEEVVVTAEKRESSVQDTSISITAFEGQFLEDFGIRNQEDLANFIPATTIQPYDMAVRGIGRSFRALDVFRRRLFRGLWYRIDRRRSLRYRAY